MNVERMSQDIARASSLAECNRAELDEDQMMLRSKTTGKEKRRNVTIINMNASRKIMPSKTGIASLSFQPKPVTELTVAVAEPICYELGKESWRKSLVSLTPPQLRKQFIQMVESPPWKPAEPFLRKNRALKWRGEEIPEGRIMTVIIVPNEQVDKVLSLSGKRGIIVDFAKKKDKQKFDEEYVNIWLPQEWDMKKVLQKFEELPQQVKNVTRGIIPTAKGYALRTQKKHEAEITRHVNPNRAEKLGPALGIHEDLLGHKRGAELCG